MPAAPDLFELDGLNFYEDYSGVAWTLCTNWVESWKDVLEWENKIWFYDEFFVLFDGSTGDVSCSCSSFGVCVSAYGGLPFPVLYRVLVLLLVHISLVMVLQRIFPVL